MGKPLPGEINILILKVRLFLVPITQEGVFSQVEIESESRDLSLLDLPAASFLRGRLC
jgi:hypothetical protein